MKIDFMPNLQRSWVAAAVGVGTAIYSGVRAAKQKRDAKKLEDKNRMPTQETPEAVKEAEQLAQNAAGVGLPGASYQQAQRNIGRSASTAIGAARDRGSALAAIPYIQQQSNDATLNLDVADANARMQKQQQLIGQKNLVGQYQQNAWDWNKKQKYLNNAATIRALLGASNENMNNAIDRGLGAVAGVAGNFAGGGSGSFSNYTGYGGGKPPIYANGNNSSTDYSEFQTQF